MSKAKPPAVHDEAERGRKSGKRSGYVERDGKLFLAPMYVDRFEELQNQRKGVDDLLRSVNSFAATRLTELARSQSRLWDDIADDLGLDLGAAHFSYHCNERCIVRTPYETERAGVGEGAQDAT